MERDVNPEGGKNDLNTWKFKKQIIDDPGQIETKEEKQ